MLKTLGADMVTVILSSLLAAQTRDGSTPDGDDTDPTASAGAAACCAQLLRSASPAAVPPAWIGELLISPCQHT